MRTNLSLLPPITSKKTNNNHCQKKSQVFEGSLVCTVTNDHAVCRLRTMQSADCILSPMQSADCAGSQIACNICKAMFTQLTRFPADSANNLHSTGVWNHSHINTLGLRGPDFDLFTPGKYFTTLWFIHQNIRPTPMVIFVTW